MGDISYVYARPDVATLSFQSVASYMQVLLLRNFATPVWGFVKGAMTSRPGCIIASPSSPSDALRDTDQDYVHHWVRDAAICVVEAIDNPLVGDGILDDYVAFSRRCQQANPARACFRIDGTPRDWTDQADGPADRLLSVVELYNRLAPATRDAAAQLVRDDLAYLLAHHQDRTVNPWEETEGEVFYARSVQLRALARLALDPAKFGIGAGDRGRIDAAVAWLRARLRDHEAARGGVAYYRSVLNAANPGGGAPRGDDLDVDVVMTAVYGAGSPRDDVLLSTAALVRAAFTAGGAEPYPINAADAGRGIGPVIGRYPGDVYDGDVSDGGVGHAWPLCTCNFAELYYRVAGALVEDPASVPWNANTQPFFGQVGAGGPDDPDRVAKLVAAGDAMLCAVLYHSDNLTLSEQFDRGTGMERSVRSLSWSYAAFLHAARTRTRLFGNGFGSH